MRTIASMAIPAVLLIGACAEPSRAAAPPSVRPEPVNAAPGVVAAQAPIARHFGQPVDESAPMVRLADIVSAPQQYGERALRVEGEVVAVCQARGCWMEIRDASTQAHIRMHGHSFFVPRDLRGHHAAVEATLVAAHPATECDHEALAATGQTPQVELDATGVEVLD